MGTYHMFTAVTKKLRHAAVPQRLRLYCGVLGEFVKWCAKDKEGDGLHVKWPTGGCDWVVGTLVIMHR